MKFPIMFPKFPYISPKLFLNSTPLNRTRMGWVHSEARGLRIKVVSQSPTLNFENVHHPHPKGFFFTHHKTQGKTLS
jgi:hypothetical protein